MNEPRVNTAATGASSRTEHAAAMAGYIAQGEIRGAATGNRGPVRLDEHGKLHADIRNAYREKGFYIFEGLIEAEELDILRAEANNMIDRAPVWQGANVDAQGRRGSLAPGRRDLLGVA